VPQLGCRRAKVVRVLLLEHGDERTHLSLAETYVPRVERTAEMKREVAVTIGDAGVGSRRRGKGAHDIARNRDDLAVEPDLYRLCHFVLWPTTQDPETTYAG